MHLISLKDEKEKEKQQSCCEKEKVYPCIFSKYAIIFFRSESFPTRSGLATSSFRCENTAASEEEQCNNFCNADKIKSFNIIITKVSEDLHRHG